MSLPSCQLGQGNRRQPIGIVVTLRTRDRGAAAGIPGNACLAIGGIVGEGYLRSLRPRDRHRRPGQKVVAVVCVSDEAAGIVLLRTVIEHVVRVREHDVRRAGRAVVVAGQQVAGAVVGVGILRVGVVLVGQLVGLVVRVGDRIEHAAAVDPFFGEHVAGIVVGPARHAAVGVGHADLFVGIIVSVGG